MFSKTKRRLAVRHGIRKVFGLGERALEPSLSHVSSDHVLDVAVPTHDSEGRTLDVSTVEGPIPHPGFESSSDPPSDIEPADHTESELPLVTLSLSQRKHRAPPQTLTPQIKIETSSKETKGMDWLAVKETFMNVKDASVDKLPKLAGLLAAFLGFATELEEMQNTKDYMKMTLQQLQKLIRALNKLNARSDLSPDIRASLTRINSYSADQQGCLEKRMKDMKSRGYLTSAVRASEVLKEIVRIITYVHGELLLLHIDIEDMSRDADVIQDVLRPVSLPSIITSQDRGCMTGTRTAILARLLGWATDPNAPRIFWLSGMAGTGKTAIAQSFCDSLRQHDIFAPSFFCSRRTSVHDHQNPMRIFPTLSALMARKHIDFKAALLSQLALLGPDRDPLCLTLMDQFAFLVQAPLNSHWTEPLVNTVFVIDALDELEDSLLTGEFIDILLWGAQSLPVKFFLTSRPEDQIRFRFPSGPSELQSILRLHDVEQDTVKEDIKLYLTHKLQDIWQLHYGRPHSSQTPWPATVQLDRLSTLADNLFLYASTVVRYLMQGDPERRLRTLLNAQSVVATASLDDTYRWIMATAFPPEGLEPQEKDDRKRCLGTLICACRPLSIQDMAELLDLSVSDVEMAFKPLHSVVYVPTNRSYALSTYHVSFQEYITTESRSGKEEWFVRQAWNNSFLTDRCLRIMFDLRFNITQSRSSYSAMTTHGGHEGVSRRLTYGCLFGVEHLSRSQLSLSTVVFFTECLCDRFLFWVEVLSAVGSVDKAPLLLMKLVSLIDVQEYFPRPYLRDFVLNGHDFIKQSQQALSLSVPHIYLSALPFADPESKVRQRFEPLFSNTLKTRDPLYSRVPAPRLVLRNDAALDPYSVAVSPDSTRFVSGSEDYTIRVFDARTGQEVCEPLEGHTDRVFSVAFSPDSSRIVSGSSDHTIRVWDTTTSEEVCEPLTGHTGTINCVPFSRDSKRIASGSADKTIRVWDTTTWKEVCVPLKGHWDVVSSVAFSPNSTLIVSGSKDKTIRIWDTRMGVEVREPLQGHTAGVLSVAFSPGATCIVSGSEDWTIRVWDADIGKEICPPLEDDMGPVCSVAFFSDSSGLILSGSQDSRIRVWDIWTRKELCKPLKTHMSVSLRSVAMSPDNKLIITKSDAGTLEVWDARMVIDYHQPLHIDLSPVVSVTFSADSARLITGSMDMVIRVWDEMGNQVSESLHWEPDALYPQGIAFSPDSAYIAFRTGTLHGVGSASIVAMDARTGEEIFERDFGVTVCAAFSPDSSRIASGVDHTIRVWDTKGELVCGPITGHEGAVICVAFSRDSKYIVSGSYDRTVRIWDALTGEQLGGPFESHNGSVISVAFSPDSTCIASGSEDRTIRVWDVQTGLELCKPLERHAAPVCSVTFSHDSMRIASGSEDHTIRVWEYRTGKEVCEPFTGHTGPVNSLAFSADSTRIVSTAWDKTIRVWDTSMNKALASDISSSHFPGVTTSPDKEEIASGPFFRPSDDWDESGWVVSSSGERLFWVPAEFRRGFYCSRTMLVIGARPCRVDLSRFTHGEEWVRCYTGA